MIVEVDVSKYDKDLRVEYKIIAHSSGFDVTRTIYNGRRDFQYIGNCIKHLWQAKRAIKKDSKKLKNKIEKSKKT